MSDLKVLESVSEVFAAYRHELDSSKNHNDLALVQTVFVRFVVPCLGGPLPKGKKATEKEVKASLEFLQQVHVNQLRNLLNTLEEYLDEINVPLTKRRRLRFYLKKFIDWAIEQQHLVKSIPDSVAQVLNAYKEYLLSINEPRILSETQTIFMHYLIPAWGGLAPMNRRVSEEEIEIGIEFLQKVPLEYLQNSVDALNQQFTHKDLSLGGQRALRSFLKRMLAWVVEQGWIETYQKAEPPVEVYRFNSPRGQRRTYISDISLSGRSRKKRFALLDSEINVELQEELNSFTSFLAEEAGLRKSTISKIISDIRRILGWLYRFRNEPLHQLRLETIIPVVHLKLKKKDFIREHGEFDRNAYALAKEIAQETAEELAIDTVKLINEYLDFTSNSPKTQTTTLTSLICLAKFLYKDETDVYKAENFSDIPVLLTLHRLHRLINKSAKISLPTVPYEKKSVSWEKALEVLKKLKKEADLTFLYTPDTTCRSGYARPKRKDIAVAKSLQRFLIVGFFVIIPPDRSRTIQQLEVGRTLLKGKFDGGVFTPAEEMPADSEPEWWIHLLPEDYKTGKRYKEYWGLVPNVLLGEGKSFYYYIDLWLSKYRMTFNPNHSCFFTTNKGQPTSTHAVRTRVQTAFLKFTGTPVSPKEFRKMFVTYLKENQASEAELESASVAMHHSKETQAQFYDQQTQQSKLKPIYEFNKLLFQKAFNVAEQPSNPEDD
jgi:hypothetical protein